MKSYDHKYLAEYLSQTILDTHSYLQTRLFIHGCVFPDHNPIGYLQGLFTGHPMKIHFTTYSIPKLQRLLEKLEEKDALSLWDFYRLGVLTHYLADAFTYPHNENFTDNMLAHAKYESQDLHTALTELLSDESGEPPLPENNLRKGASLWYTFCSLHKTYEQTTPTAQMDAAYIVPLCLRACREFAYRIPAETAFSSARVRFVSAWSGIYRRTMS